VTVSVPKKFCEVYFMCINNDDMKYMSYEIETSLYEVWYKPFLICMLLQHQRQ